MDIYNPKRNLPDNLRDTVEIDLKLIEAQRLANAEIAHVRKQLTQFELITQKISSLREELTNTIQIIRQRGTKFTLDLDAEMRINSDFGKYLELKETLVVTIEANIAEARGLYYEILRSAVLVLEHTYHNPEVTSDAYRDVADIVSKLRKIKKSEVIDGTLPQFNSQLVGYQLNRSLMGTSPKIAKFISKIVATLNTISAQINSWNNFEAIAWENFISTDPAETTTFLAGATFSANSPLFPEPGDVNARCARDTKIICAQIESLHQLAHAQQEFDKIPTTDQKSVHEQRYNAFTHYRRRRGQARDEFVEIKINKPRLGIYTPDGKHHLLDVDPNSAQNFNLKSLYEKLKPLIAAAQQTTGYTPHPFVNISRLTDSSADRRLMRDIDADSTLRRTCEACAAVNFNVVILNKSYGSSNALMNDIRNTALAPLGVPCLVIANDCMVVVNDHAKADGGALNWHTNQMLIRAKELKLDIAESTDSETPTNPHPHSDATGPVLTPTGEVNAKNNHLFTRLRQRTIENNRELKRDSVVIDVNWLHQKLERFNNKRPMQVFADKLAAQNINHRLRREFVRQYPLNDNLLITFALQLATYSLVGVDNGVCLVNKTFQKHGRTTPIPLQRQVLRTAAAVFEARKQEPAKSSDLMQHTLTEQDEIENKRKAGFLRHFIDYCDEISEEIRMTQLGWPSMLMQLHAAEIAFRDTSIINRIARPLIGWTRAIFSKADKNFKAVTEPVLVASNLDIVDELDLGTTALVGSASIGAGFINNRKQYKIKVEAITSKLNKIAATHNKPPFTVEQFAAKFNEIMAELEYWVMKTIHS
jgi:hypothetical protein